jgi:inhibitor of cysteine peptidase
MKKRTLQWLAVLAVALIVVLSMSACAKSGGASVTLRATDTGRTIELKRGDTLIVELEGNPTTGFQWEVESVDTAILKRQGDAEFKAEKPGLPGSQGVFVFTFGAEGSGQTDLEMIYHQSWDKETPPSQTFDVSVVVE